MERKSFTSGTPVLLGSVTTRSPKTCGVNNLLRTHRLVRRIEDGQVQVGWHCLRRPPDRLDRFSDNLLFLFILILILIRVYLCSSVANIPLSPKIHRHIPTPYHHQKHGEHLAVS